MEYVLMRLLQRTLEVISLVRYKNDFIPCSSIHDFKFLPQKPILEESEREHKLGNNIHNIDIFIYIEIETHFSLKG